ncbi:response regulator [Streptomyces sp. NPDC001393]
MPALDPAVHDSQDDDGHGDDGVHASRRPRYPSAHAHAVTLGRARRPRLAGPTAGRPGGGPRGRNRVAQVVGEAWDVRSKVGRARSLAPDVVLMDIRMPGADGIAATRMRGELPTSPTVVVLTTFGYDVHIESALKAGSSGFLVKDAPPAELLKSLISLTVGDAAQPADPDSLRLASDPGLTEGTVKGRVTQVMERLGATNRVEAARVAFIGPARARGNPPAGEYKEWKGHRQPADVRPVFIARHLKAATAHP